MPLLDDTHQEIDACRLCEGVDGFFKPASMSRGGCAPLMIIGQGPGKTERTSGKAFSGQSGTRIDGWLRSIVTDGEDIRKSVYLTSIIKCIAQDTEFNKLLKQCHPFLIKQINSVQPDLIWTLGEQAYRAMNVSRLPFKAAQFHVFNPFEESMLQEWNSSFKLIPLPHPSGANRIWNKPITFAKMDSIFEISKEILKAGGRWA